MAARCRRMASLVSACHIVGHSPPRIELRELSMYKKIFGKRSAFLGLALIVIGLLFNKAFVEAALIPDHHLEQPGYIALLYGFQLLAIALGAFLLIKQPAIKLPGKTELALLTSSLLLTFFLLEIVARVWLNYLATP